MATPGAPLRIAVLEVCRVAEFFHDLTLPCLAGALRDGGFSVERFRLMLEGPSAGWPERCDRFVARLVDHGADLLLLPDVLEREVIAAVERAGRPFAVMVLVSYAVRGAETERPAWVLRATADRDDLLARARAFAADLVSGAPHAPAPPGDLTPLDDLRDPARRERLLSWIDPFRPILAWRDAETWRVAVDRRQAILGSHGCAYAADAADNNFFQGIDFARLPEVFRFGCTFCHHSGIIRLPREETVRLLLAQLAEVRRQAPDLAEVVLEDEEALGYLDRFAAAVLAAGGKPLRFLVKTRVLLLRADRDKLTAALSTFAGTGHRIDLYLVGFENFSQPELDRFNKGVSAAECEEAASLLRSLRDQFPDSFSDDTHAKGFILFTPWTSLADLEANVAAFRRLRFWEFRGNLPLSKLRLDPSLPLYHAAARDGLLADRFPDAAHDNSRRYGYSGEAPWRFLHAEAGRVYAVYVRASEGAGDLLPLIRNWEDRAAQVALLEHLVALAAADPGANEETLYRRAAEWAEAGRRRVAGGARAPAPAPADALLASPGASEEVTRQTMPFCNCNCVFCSDGGSPNIARKYQTDAREELTGAVDHWLSPEVDLTTIVGGEPTIHPLFFDLLARARARGRGVFLLSNGRMFSYPGFARRAFDAGLTRLQVSIHGHRAEVHDGLTRSPGSFEQSWEGAANAARELLRRRSPRALEFCYVITARNYRWLREFVHLVSALPGAVRVNFTTLIPRGWGERHYHQLAVRYADVMPHARRAVADHGGREGRVRFSFQAPPCVAPDLAERLGSAHDCDGAVAANPLRRDACRVCAAFHSCLGPFEAYVRRFGWDEFVPLAPSGSAAPAPAHADGPVPLSHLPVEAAS
ncbi:MAG: radical SAM protein [Planctomycetes bacterium]|nr:radical SAM protein [Planctomycetota bacterium]